MRIYCLQQTELQFCSKDEHRMQFIPWIKKSKGKGKIILVHSMTAYGGTAPRILNHGLDTGEWWRNSPAQA